MKSLPELTKQGDESYQRLKKLIKLAEKQGHCSTIMKVYKRDSASIIEHLKYEGYSVELADPIQVMVVYHANQLQDKYVRLLVKWGNLK